MMNQRKQWKIGRKEWNTSHLDINKDGELIIREGNYQYNIYDIARKIGSPVEIFLPFILEQRLQNLFDIFEKHTKSVGYKGKCLYHYPMKVNQNKEYVLTLVAEGAHLEVSSANELWLVQKLWEDQNFYKKIRVLCNGPKTTQYLQLIFNLQEKGLSIIPVIENLDELDLLKDFKGDLGIRANLKTKVKSHWGHKIDRFGLTEEEIMEIGKLRNIKVLHYHLGSQIERERDLIAPIKEAFGIYAKLKEKNPGLDTLDIGGGHAVAYEKRRIYSTDSVVKRILNLLYDLSAEANIPHPNLIVEWGRHIVAPAQLTVYRVVGTKSIPKGPATAWYIVDGSFMNDLLDTWALHQKWHVIPVNNADAEHRQKVWLAGLSCDADDQYTASEGFLLLPRTDDLKPGEDLFLGVLDTGAYQDAFGSHHCLLASPAKIVLQNGIVTLARKRESAQDIGKLFGW